MIWPRPRLGSSLRHAAGRDTNIGSNSTPVSYPVTIRDLEFGAVHVSRLEAIAQDLSPMVTDDVRINAQRASATIDTGGLLTLGPPRSCGAP